MASCRPGLPDWRDASAYLPLRQVSRDGIAWEWLRRNKAYRAASAEAAAGRGAGPLIVPAEPRAAQWGLHAFEDPRRPAWEARPVWRAEVSPSVLEVDAAPAEEGSETFELEPFSSVATLVREKGGIEHLLLSNGRHGIRVDVATGTLLRGPATFRYRLSGFDALEPRLLTLRRLLALRRNARFSQALHHADRRGARWVMLLRAHDALVAGAAQREIAEHLLGREAAAPRWRIEASTLRSRSQRLVRQARHLAAGGYLALLA